MTTPIAPATAGTSTRPYLIRALHDWCTDNGFTPYIAVFVDDAVRVPKEYVKNSEIVLNVGFEATSALKLGNGQYCYPLTVTDHASRFLLLCEAGECSSGPRQLGMRTRTNGKPRAASAATSPCTNTAGNGARMILLEAANSGGLTSCKQSPLPLSTTLRAQTP